MIASSKSRNPSIMDADPAIMEAGRNAQRPLNADEGGVGVAGKVLPAKANTTLMNKMKMSRPLKMKGLNKAFFRADRPSLTSTSSSSALKTSAAIGGDGAKKRNNNGVVGESTSTTGCSGLRQRRRRLDSDVVDADPTTTKSSSKSTSDSSSTTLDEDDEEDDSSSSPLSGGDHGPLVGLGWSSKTKAMFGNESFNKNKSKSGNSKVGAAAAALAKSQLQQQQLKSASTSSFDAVTKLDSTSSSVLTSNFDSTSSSVSVMDITGGNDVDTSSSGEIMNFDMSMSSNGSEVAEGAAETLDSEFGRVLHLCNDDNSNDDDGVDDVGAAAPDVGIVDSPQCDKIASNPIVAAVALNAPKPGPTTRGNQRLLSAAANAANAAASLDFNDDVFEENTEGRGGALEGALGVAETPYAREIISYLLRRQAESQAIIPFPSSLGTLARGDTRAILISWIVQVHDYEGLENESLYMTVRITDTYCSLHDVVLADVQLVGIAAIFIASKQEERFPPEGKDLVRYTNNAYDIRDLYKMELQILDRLNFKVNMPICWTFAAYLLSLSSSSTSSSSSSSANHCQQQRPRPREVDWMTHYLLELSLLSKPAIVFSPSLVASAAVYMARFLFLDPETADPWPSTLSVPSTHSLVSLRPAVGELLAMLQLTPNSKYNASFLKYSSESKFRGLSKLPVLHNSLSLKRLAAGLGIAAGHYVTPCVPKTPCGFSA